MVTLVRFCSSQDLLTHTSGLCYGGVFGDHPVEQRYARDRVYEGLSMHGRPLAQFSEHVAQHPLMFHPGQGWCTGLQHLGSETGF